MRTISIGATVGFLLSKALPGAGIMQRGLERAALQESGSPQPRHGRGPYVVIVAGFLALAMSRSPEASAQTVPITEAKKATTAYTAVLQQAATKDPQILFEVAFVTRALRNNPNIDGAQLNQLIGDMRFAWKLEVQPSTDIMEWTNRIFSVGLDVLKKVNPRSNVYDVLKDTWDDLFEPMLRDYAANKDYVTSTNVTACLAQYARSEKGARQIEQFYNTCRQTGNASHACDTAMLGQHPEIDLSVLDTFATMLAKHGDVAALQDLNGPAFNPEAALAKLLAEIGGVHQVSATSLAYVKQLAEQAGQLNGSFKDWVANQAARAEWAAKAEAERKFDELKLPAAQSSIYVLSTLVGIANPERGRQIAVTGSAALQVANALSRFKESAAWISQLDQGKQKWATTMSAAVMTGDMVGAALQIVSLFSKSGPSPEAMILQELQKISQQIDQVRTEMHERFDRVDAALNEIYSKMTENFAKIDWQLGQISDDVREIQVALLDVQENLKRLESNIHAFLDTASRQDLLKAVNGDLRYAQRTNLVMLYLPTFIDAENEFHTWVTISSRDTIRAGIPRNTVDDILADLDSFPLHQNINNLRIYPNLAFGLPELHGARLANPLDALFGAQSWMALMNENPQHSRRIGAFRREEIRQTLAQVQSALATIRNTALFAALIADYKAHSATVTAEIAKLSRSDYGQS